ncbi:MAG TPA: acetyl-CoA hydrolase/transferase C-terminal domain-containing protein [Acidimicrobiia bacterium]|nr:acetyl-CoA hydrolase/transferase C-terminal domain-containing protein [Acidimicrobiia bacterium]
MSVQATRASEPTAVLAHIEDGADLVVPLANGEPRTLIDAIDAAAESLEGVRVRQMHALHEHPYLHGVYGDKLRHVAYFLSAVTRKAFAEGGCDLVPANFSEVPLLLRKTTKCSLVLAAASPPDRHGYFSLGTNADYTARFIGQVPFFLEVNPNMPRTFGENSIHVSQIEGWVEADYPLIEVAPPPASEKDRAIAALVAERVPDGATIQAGIGAIPNAILGMLTERRNLGIHTELISDGVMDLMDSGAITGTNKVTRPGKITATFALGTQRLYDFLHENPAVEFLPVDWLNDPRVIGREHAFVSINATVEVDLLGQCNSEMIAGRYYSGSGGQADFARGAMYSEHGLGFVVLHSTTADEQTPRIVAQLCPGAPVTTMKNTVDHVVTEYGVAELRGRSIAERARDLIAVAHPKFRDQLTAEAKALGYLRD